jgi:pyridoxal 5'-phosphate synthase pdxT subunit
MSSERMSRAERRPLGVLALQGAFARHAERLAERGHEVRLVRDARDFMGLAGLVLPGGESTVQLDLLARLGLEGKLVELVRARVPVLATCAGLILLARGVAHPAQRSFGLLDVDVARNAYGRQLHSFEASSDEAWPPSASGALDDASSGEPSPLPLVFIRAPRIERVGARVEVLARHRGEPVLVREGNITAATFHPELTLDSRVHDAVFGRA